MKRRFLAFCLAGLLTGCGPSEDAPDDANVPKAPSGDGDVAGNGGTTSDPGVCALPACLVALTLDCMPSGSCIMDENLATGDQTVVFENGVTQLSMLDVSDYSTAITVQSATGSCYSTGYIENDFRNAADVLTVKNAGGETVATLSMDTVARNYLVTCSDGENVSIPSTCDDAWPLAGLMTLASNACDPSDTGSGGTSGTGGTEATGGTGPGTGGVINNPVTEWGTERKRAILPLEHDWLFEKSDPPGAQGAEFADSGWHSINLPHDWAIEGPFSATAPTTGRGAYAPSGVAWYRKHFTLPEEFSEREIFVEFDGVMENSTVYLNGVQLGHHPYGYVAFQYNMTDAAKFGAEENVLAVRTDTSLQPNSRYYAGGGIYRDVRVIATDPVHVAQWATHVTTPNITDTSAMVRVETTVVNDGATPADVTVTGIVMDPGGTILDPAAAPGASIAPGESADFSFEVLVDNPELWSPDSPSLHQLEVQVQVGGITVDDDRTTFGIRSLVFDPMTGFSINGEPMKLIGACLHQDFHGLGMAAPQRAIQRRFAQLKQYGINAVRVSHDPASAEFLDVADRMGILVMDEFFDVWSSHRYDNVGDYAAYFNETATAPTGMPEVPGVVGGAKWYEVDITGIVMRDRNHPSVIMYSTGNEIRDAIGTRTPYLTRMVEIAHALDPDRPITQALFRPKDSGDVDGATRSLLDVFGGNYRSDEVLEAMAIEPRHAGVLTEVGTQTATWGTVTSNDGLIGFFMWTGVDYLGEADGLWPVLGADYGMLDAMGNPKDIAFAWQQMLGVAPTNFSTGALDGRVVLTADHTNLTTDLDDVVYVKAAVTSATAPVTFSVEGPGIILAVDSGSQENESFRGDTRKAFGGLAYAIIQATGPGTISVTATSPGLADGTTQITAIEDTFFPCLTSCN